MGEAVIRCERCGAASKVLTCCGDRRMRQCTNGHRWQTVERPASEPTDMPATRESLFMLRAEGLSIRQIAGRLLMSPKTVCAALNAHAVTLRDVMQGSWGSGRDS
jgi:DNA-binding NarL/FixJ family response regulator